MKTKWLNKYINYLTFEGRMDTISIHIGITFIEKVNYSDILVSISV